MDEPSKGSDFEDRGLLTGDSVQQSYGNFLQEVNDEDAIFDLSPRQIGVSLTNRYLK